MRSHRHSRGCAGGGLVVGMTLLFVGMLFLLVNVGVLASDFFRVWWPVILIAMGVAKLFGRSRWDPPRPPYNDFA